MEIQSVSPRGYLLSKEIWTFSAKQKQKQNPPLCIQTYRIMLQSLARTVQPVLLFILSGSLPAIDLTCDGRCCCPGWHNWPSSVLALNSRYCSLAQLARTHFSSHQLVLQFCLSWSTHSSYSPAGAFRVSLPGLFLVFGFVPASTQPNMVHSALAGRFYNLAQPGMGHIFMSPAGPSPACPQTWFTQVLECCNPPWPGLPSAEALVRSSRSCGLAWEFPNSLPGLLLSPDFTLASGGST